jgi:hypothetical protein
MTFPIVKGLVSSIIKTVQESAVISVRALKAHTFSSRVVNLPDTQKVSGKVEVSNQGKLEKEVQSLHKPLEMIASLIKKIKAPESIRVTNFPPPAKFPAFPKKIEVSNMPRIPRFPGKIEVSNQPRAELVMVGAKIDSLTGEIKKLKLDPKIEVQSPPQQRIVVPPAQVTVSNDIDYEKLATLIGEQIPGMDYGKLADVLSKRMSEMVITGGSGGGSYAYKNAQGRGSSALIDDDRSVATYSADYKLQDMDRSEPTYLGLMKPGGAWRIIKYSDGESMRYASGLTEYAENWSNRALLDYAYINGEL